MLIQSIHEILEGEGPNAGIPMLMLRTSGCNLRCKDCDQPDALDTQLGRQYDLQQLAAVVSASKHQWIAVSGGEPLLWSDELGSLIFRFPGRDWEINTNGSLPVPSWWASVKSWMVDSKVPSSGMKSSRADKWANALRPQDCLKFVVRTEEDLEFVLKNRADCCQNLVSPIIWDVKMLHMELGMLIGREQMLWNRRVAEFCLEHDLRFSLQTHKVLWGMERQDK